MAPENTTRATRWRPGAVCLVLATIAALMAAPLGAQEVVVFGGPESARSWLIDEQWWGEPSSEESRAAPRILITGIHPSWRETAQDLTVSDKKQLFYRLMLPLIVLANEMVLERRTRILAIRERLAAGNVPEEDEMSVLRAALTQLRVVDADAARQLDPSAPELSQLLDQLLYKLDVIPNGLAMGQAAYESGYGTSRFAVEGNALFGQWTFGGEGLIPAEQRQQLGDHRIAAYDWPFDSVRAYFINLMSHPAYEEFRRLRAGLRNRGEPLSSLTLADGLTAYSERGEEYVETLKGMIRVNGLDHADGVGFRDEPTRYLIGAGTPENAATLRGRVDTLQRQGELDAIIARMRLD